MSQSTQCLGSVVPLAMFYLDFELISTKTNRNTWKHQDDQIFDIISQFLKFLNDDPEEKKFFFQSAKKASDGNEIDQISGCW